MLAYIDLVQDIDVLLPVLAAMRDDAEIEPRIAVASWLARESPRTETLLARHGLRFGWVRRPEVVAGRAPGLRGVAAVLSASESSHPAHAAAHALAQRATAAGLPAYTLQHGWENVGLCGPEAAYGFASSTVFCWFAQEAVPPETPAENRRKLSHVGRVPMPAPASDGPQAYEVGVFENLHADRYSDADREAFAAGLRALAEAGIKTLVRPHPAGGWSEALQGLVETFPNVLVQSAAMLRREAEGIAEVLLQCQRVITTPSTVAVDALEAGRPVALAADGGAAYADLPVLRRPRDWLEFAASSSESQEGVRRALLGRMVEGDGTPRILRRIESDLRQKKLAQPVRMW